MRPISAVMAKDMQKLNNPNTTYIYGSSSTPKRAKKSASMALPPRAPPAEVNNINPTSSAAMRCSPGRIWNASRIRVIRVWERKTHPGRACAPDGFMRVLQRPGQHQPDQRDHQPKVQEQVGLDQETVREDADDQEIDDNQPDP